MAWMPMRLDGMTAKIEATYGTDSVPAVATDALRVERLWSSVRIIENWPNKRSDVASGSALPTKPGIPRGRYVEASIAWECRGAGSDLVIEAAPILRAAGWAEVDGVSKFDYTLASSAHDSASCYFYAGDLLIKAVGCRASLRWGLTPGQIHKWRFLIRGRLGAEPATTVLPASFGYDTTAALSGVGLTVTVGAWSPAIIAAEFDQGTEPILSEDANQTDGLGEFDWAEPEPFLTLTARKPALATYDPYADALARTTRAINATLGSTQFNRLKLSLPETYVETPAPADSQGFVNHQLRYNLAGTMPVITSD